jgi:hypothetical protein
VYRTFSVCGVRYWIVEPDALPEAAEIRAYFLAADAQPAAEKDREIGGYALASAKVRLRATVEGSGIAGRAPAKRGERRRLRRRRSLIR